MDRLVDHLLVLEGGGVIRDFPGNYTQYRFWLKEQEKKEPEKKEISAPTATSAKTADVPATARRKMSYKEKREWEQLEQDLARLTKEKEELILKMSGGNLPFSELESMGNQMATIQASIDQAEMRWLELSELVPAG